jgi:deazaflavin-dependent oxidoreductase (nitroreductase family)
MKIMLKLFMGLHVLLYRLSGGRLGGKMGGNQVVILNTQGRKSGKIHSNPVVGFEREGGYLVIASNGGGARHPAWYFNLKANPLFELQVMDKVLRVRAEELSGEKRAALWQTVLKAAPNFGKYEQATTREIPLVLLKSV